MDSLSVNSSTRKPSIPGTPSTISVPTDYSGSTSGSANIHRTDARDNDQNAAALQSSRNPVDEIRLANQYSPARKWTIAIVICIIQISMNINTSLYSNAMPGVMEEFNISAQAFRAGSAVFLVMYALGSLLWAPWSEELGRKNVLQVSLFLVNCKLCSLSSFHRILTR